MSEYVCVVCGYEGHTAIDYDRPGWCRQIGELNDRLAAQEAPAPEGLRRFAEDIDKTIAEAGIEGRHMAGTLLDVRWVPQGAVESALALIPGLPCPMRSSLTDAPCTLLWGHAQASDIRFHAFATERAEARPPEGPHETDIDGNHWNGCKGCRAEAPTPAETPHPRGRSLVCSIAKHHECDGNTEVAR